MNPYTTYGPLLFAEAIGTPVPQGSIRSLGAGRPSVHSNARDLLPWRDTLVAAIRTEMTRNRIRVDWPVVGPIAVDATFTVRKPAGAPKRRRTWPDRRPDLDKLLRAALDALTVSGAIGDDAQVVQATARKAYPRECHRSLDVPGALIVLLSVGQEQP